jgi:tetratricopeptide (TPR) repeat protein
MSDRGEIQSLRFFVSYTAVDRAWAEWIAWQLEAAGHRVVVQAWDFRPGENFIINMLRALDSSDRTLAVVSAAYLESVYGSDEWTAAFIHDRPGETSVLAVRVEDVPLPRLLRPWIYVDLVGVDQEAATRQLLDGVRPGRRKPEQPPAFPPTKAPAQGGTEPSFPGRGPGISNLPPRNPTFTGRDVLLTELREQLARDAPVAVVAQALYGLGGVGKTQLALEYAHRYSTEYDLIWWIPAENALTISSSLARLGSKLGLRALVDQEQLVASVLDALRERNRWLLVFDNAEHPEEVAPFQPAGGSGQMLVTSRNPAWGALGKSLRVNVLPRDEATGLLLSRTPDQDQASADRLATELGDLPLALEQAAAYLEQTGMPVAAYLDLFRHQRQALLGRGRAVAYEGQVDTTWQLSMDRLDHASPAGAELLRLCAFLAPEAIPLDLVTARPDRLPEALAAAAEDGEAGIQQAAGACYSFSLVDRDTAGIRVHRLVQQVIRSALTVDDRRAEIRLVLELLDAALPLGAEITDPQRWPRFAQLQPHVLACAQHAQEAGIADATTAALLQRTAAHLWWVRGEYGAARDILERALALGDAALAPDHPSTGWILTDLGAVLRELGDPAGARLRLEQALATWRAASTPNPGAEASTLTYLGRALHDLGDLPGARVTLSRAVAIQQDVVGPTDPAAGSAMGHLGEVLRVLGDLVDARSMQEQALAVKSAALGPDHPSVGRTTWNLGKVLHDLGDFSGARAAFEQSLAILEVALGPNHPNVGSTCRSLATVLHDQGDLAGAKMQMARAHTIFQAAFGPSHPSTQGVARWLADVRCDEGDAELSG